MMVQNELDLDDPSPPKRGERISITSSLITQGKHRLYTLTMFSNMLAETCFVENAAENPLTGFQRRLDSRRAQEIADYIDTGFGTIPGSIVLSAQKAADFQYTNKVKTISFKNTPHAFLILDGQHRVFGFQKAKSRLRVPVVIYNDLSRAEEARLFVDINTKQRPVPGELLLAIKHIAETEKDWETLLRKVFDLFDKDANSPLMGLVSPIEKLPKKISRKTFNTALRPVLGTFSDNEPNYIYETLRHYLYAWLSGLRVSGAEQNITNPTLFKAVINFFPTVAEKVVSRHQEEFTTENFEEMLRPFFQRIKKSELQKPGSSHVALCESFKKILQSGFSIGRRRD
jgi:DGQHR domain-containing protein